MGNFTDKAWGQAMGLIDPDLGKHSNKGNSFVIIIFLINIYDI
jgi:hypothetical protein